MDKIIYDPIYTIDANFTGIWKTPISKFDKH